MSSSPTRPTRLHPCEDPRKSVSVSWYASFMRDPARHSAARRRIRYEKSTIELRHISGGVN